MQAIEEKALLPDGSEALVRVAPIDDPYIEDESETVAVAVALFGPIWCEYVKLTVEPG